DPSGTAAERLEAERAGAGAAVDDEEPVEALPEPVEQGLLDPIREGPCLETARGGEPPSSERPADDPQAAVGGSHQRLTMSCAPQCPQYAAWRLRAAACSASVQGRARMLAFTTPPHSGQCPTGAFGRRWFMFSQGLGFPNRPDM